MPITRNLVRISVKIALKSANTSCFFPELEKAICSNNAFLFQILFIDYSKSDINFLDHI